MSQPLDILIIERIGTQKVLSIKDFKPEDLFKKCGFKKADNFNKQMEWNVKLDGKKYVIQIFAKTEGRANSENKYDFPPPIDNELFYGSCAVVAQVKKEDGTKVYTNLSVLMWGKLYEKLFGGFEDLSSTAKEDDNEEDELDNVPKENKTKQGYLKDGFVLDSSDTEEPVNSLSDDESTEDDVEIEDIGSELSEESYEYDDKV